MTTKKKTIRPRFSLIPKSTATNAYQLLDEVIAAIVEEPARLNQGGWVFPRGHVSAMDHPPVCGTVGCTAGWITFIHNRRILPEDEISPAAARLLGCDQWDRRVRVLFSGAVTDERGFEIAVGTRKYVQAVIERIRTFQHDNQNHLLAQTLDPS